MWRWTSVTVSDNVYTTLPAGCNAATLAVGGSYNCSITGTWAAGQHTNTATVTGTYVDGANTSRQVTDSDAANYYGAAPAIDIEKYVSVDNGTTWADADSVTGPTLLSGTNPRFKFVVTNTGDVTLTSVTISDNVYTTLPAGCSVATLAAGGSYECSVTGAWAAGQHTNTATVTGSYTDDSGVSPQPPVSDSDAANYFGAAPAIDIEKLVSVDGGLTWADADSVTGPTLLSGTNPQFKFVVTNTGNVALTSVTVSDNVYTTLPAGCNAATLAVGGSYNCSITGTWADGAAYEHGDGDGHVR